MGTNLDSLKVKEESNSVGVVMDNRPRLVVDAKKVETWEIMVMESGKISDCLLVFARYLCRGERPISPEIPPSPIDELSRAEISQIQNSEAFKHLKRLKLKELQGAVSSFLTQANAGF